MQIITCHCLVLLAPILRVKDFLYSLVATYRSGMISTPSSYKASRPETEMKYVLI